MAREAAGWSWWWLATVACYLVATGSGAPVELPGKINDLPVIDPYQPQKAPLVPIELGERRCDNIFHGEILPCLLRPELPPFSYSTERGYNTEYKKKK